MTCGKDCPICGGLGWVRTDAQPGDWHFGQVFPCPNRGDAPLWWAAKYGLEVADWKRGGLANLLATEAAKKAVPPIRQALKRGWGMVTLYGGWGTGKTTILRAAVREVASMNKPGRYVRLAEILEEAQAAIRDGGDGVHHTLRVWARPGLAILAVDEIDKARNTEWGREVVARLMDSWYTLALENKSMVLILALNPPEDAPQLPIEEAVPRYLASRLLDGRGVVVHTGFQDFRKVANKLEVQK